MQDLLQWKNSDKRYLTIYMINAMKTIEERAELNLMYEKDFCGYSLSDDMVCRAYVRGAEEQKAIDDERIKKLYEAIEKSKWFADSYKGKSLGEFIEVES